MPRLPFWGFSVATTAGASYAGYRFVYEPRQHAQQSEEERLARTKQRLQDVIHVFARLRARLEEQVSAASAYSNPAAASRGDTSAWFTNADKLVFFCDVQTVRSVLWTLPRHLTTEGDLRRMFEQLSAWEKQQCTELNFRAEPLRWNQTVRSVACLALFVVLFRVVSPLLNLWDGFASVQAQVLHRGAQIITQALEIETVMTVAKGKAATGETTSAPAADIHGNASSTNSLEGDKQNATTRVTASLKEKPASVQVLTLNTSHWIEEVGFWACDNNPLLRQHQDAQRNASSAESNRPPLLRLLRGSPSPAKRVDGSSPPSLVEWRLPLISTAAISTTYARHWREVAANKQRHESAAPALTTVAAAEVSLGYPMLSSVAASPSPQSSTALLGPRDVRYVPVGVSGLPHLLYVDAAHATADVRPRHTKEEVYARRQQAQFTRSTAAIAEAAANTKTNLPADHTYTLTDLQTWHGGCGGVPWWRRAWWGGVYGGPRRSVTAPSSTLRYHVGTPSTAAEYVAEAIEANRTVERYAMASQ